MSHESSKKSRVFGRRNMERAAAALAVVSSIATIAFLGVELDKAVDEIYQDNNAAKQSIEAGYPQIAASFRDAAQGASEQALLDVSFMFAVATGAFAIERAHR